MVEIKYAISYQTRGEDSEFFWDKEMEDWNPNVNSDCFFDTVEEARDTLNDEILPVVDYYNGDIFQIVSFSIKGLRYQFLNVEETVEDV